MRSYFNRFLLALLVSGSSLLLSCSKTIWSEITGSPDPQKTPLPPVAEDPENVSPPVNISGSFLTCVSRKDADPEVYQATTLCALQDELTRQKIELAAKFSSHDWQPQVPTLAGVTSRSRELEEDPRWHLELMIKADNALLLDRALQDSRVTLLVRGLEGVSMQASAPVLAVPSDCSVLAGGSWLAVPGDSTYSTSGFCIMKYEAKNIGGTAISAASGTPWVDINQAEAQAACSSLGANFHLITNDEWMSLASNIASTASNWSDGIVGSGTINRGHSDDSPAIGCDASSGDSFGYVERDCTPLNSGTWSQKRTHTLSTGAVIWDVAGNVGDWTSYVIANNSAKPYATADGSPQEAWRELSALDNNFTAMSLHELRPINAEQAFWSDAWNSTQGVGQYYGGANGTNGALVRGANWWDASGAGVFAASLGYPPSASNSAVGFRCAYSAISSLQ